MVSVTLSEGFSAINFSRTLILKSFLYLFYFGHTVFHLLGDSRTCGWRWMELGKSLRKTWWDVGKDCVQPFPGRCTDSEQIGKENWRGNWITEVQLEGRRWNHSVRKFSGSTAVRSHWSRAHNKYSLQYLYWSRPSTIKLFSKNGINRVLERELEHTNNDCTWSK